MCTGRSVCSPPVPNDQTALAVSRVSVVSLAVVLVLPDAEAPRSEEPLEEPLRL